MGENIRKPSICYFDSTHTDKQKSSIKKMSKGLEQIFLQEDIQIATMCMKKQVLSITNHEENSDQNHNKLSPHTCEDGSYKNKIKDNKCWQRCEEIGTLVPCQRDKQWCSAMENIMKVLKKIKHRTTIRYNIPTSGQLIIRTEIRIWKKYLHLHVHFNIIPIAKI